MNKDNSSFRERFFAFGIFYFFIAFVCAAYFISIVFAAADPTPGITADWVLGQASGAVSSTNRGGAVGADTLSGPQSSMSDGSKFYVADTANNRVLIWNTPTPVGGSAADIVLGQVNMTSSSENQGGVASSSTMSHPISVYSDGSKIYVADIVNHRVLIWNTTSPTTGQGADIVLGQADFTGSSANRGGAATAGSFSSPVSVFSDGSKIYVADQNNNRVLIWNTIAPVSGASANVVLGQDNFTSVASNKGGIVSSSTLAVPRAVYKDSTNIYVADGDSNRVLIWHTTSPTSGSGADYVLGQDDFTGSSINKGGSISSSTLYYPVGVFSDENNIFVTELYSNRVLVWATTTPVNGSGAQALIGTSMFTVAPTYDVSSSTLNTPVSVFFRNQKVYISDTGHNRVLRFDMNAATPGTPTISALTTNTMTVSIATNSNPIMTQYAIYDSVLGMYVASDNTLTAASPVWQTASTWSGPTVTGLTSNATSTFSVLARYIAALNTATSTESVATSTLVNVPQAVGTGSVTSSTIAVSIQSGDNNSASTVYSITETGSSTYLQSNGTLDVSEVFFSAAAWATTTVTGLSPDTLYTFKSRARTLSGLNTTALSSASIIQTLAEVSSAPTLTASSTSVLGFSLSAGNNTALTRYAVYNATSENFLDADGVATASAVYLTIASWSDIFATGLSSNTAYQFSVVPRNFDNVNSATSSVSTVVYTLVDAPSVLSASASGNSITVSWSGNATGYYVADTSDATRNSGWINSTSYQFTNLVCNKAYTFTVKGRNGDSIETSSASVSTTSASCQGGIITPYPPLLSSSPVHINNGSLFTASRNVTLTLDATRAVLMALSNTPDFIGASFVPYAPSAPWILTEGNGKKTVYIKLRSAEGAVVDTTISVMLQSGSSPVTFVPIVPIVSPAPAAHLFTKILRRWNTGAEVMLLQNRLTALGFMTVKPNGVFGPATTNAVKSFQKSQKIKQTGTLDVLTQDALNGTVSVPNQTPAPVVAAPNSSYIFTKNLQPGNRGSTVKLLQERLVNLGFLFAKPNGVFGPATTAAVKKYQLSQGVSPLGLVGPQTRARLNK